MLYLLLLASSATRFLSFFLFFAYYETEESFQHKEVPLSGPDHPQDSSQLCRFILKVPGEDSVEDVLILIWFQMGGIWVEIQEDLENDSDFQMEDYLFLLRRSLSSSVFT